MEDKAEQHQKWCQPGWRQIKHHRVAIGAVAIVFVLVIALIIAGYRFD